MSSTLTAPASVRDAWPPPNFVDPVTQGPALEYVCIVLSAVGLAIVILRLCSRALITRLLGLDDALIVVALALCIALSVLLIIGVKVWYVGYHIWDLPAASVVAHRKGMWIASYLYVLAAGSIKISILLFYRRLNMAFSKSFLIATYVGIAYNVCYVLGFVIGNSLICNPIEAYWLRYDLDWRVSHDWSCGNEAISLPANGATSVLGDLYSTIIPLLLVTSLDLPRRQKAALYALFGLGFLVVGAGIARTILLSYTVLRTYDFTWMVYESWLWSMVELYVAILTASAPALKPLLGKLFGRRFLGYSNTDARSRSTMSEVRDKSVEAGEHEVNRQSHGSYDHGKTASKKQSQDLESAFSDEEDRHIIRHVASVGLHGSLTSDARSHDVELDSLDCNTTTNFKGDEKAFPGVGTITEEGHSRYSATSDEVDPPVYPPGFSRAHYTHGHKPTRSNATIGTAITTNNVVEMNPNESRYVENGHRYTGSRTDNWSRPSTSGMNHPPTAYKPPARKSSDFVRPSHPLNSSQESFRSARSRTDGGKGMMQVRVPVYDAEFSHQSGPALTSTRNGQNSREFDVFSSYSSELDEKRQDAILTAVQQSRLSAQPKPDTRRSSMSESSWDLPFQGWSNKK